MRRRRVLAMIATGLLPGCIGDDSDGTTPTSDTMPSDTTTGTTTTSPTTTSMAGTDTRFPASPSTPLTEESVLAEAANGDFELVDLDYPRTIEIDQSVTFSFTVRNAGSRPRTFTATVGFEYHTSDSRTETPPPPTTWGEASIPPGETRTFESPSMTFPYLGTVRFRLIPFGRRFLATVMTRRLTFAEPYRLDSGAEIEIDFDRRTTEYDFTHNGERHTVEASAGRQWVFATVTAENPTEALLSIPSARAFSLEIPFVGRFDSIDEDRKDGDYYGGKIQGGSTRQGWLLFEVPEDERIDDFEFTYRHVRPDGVTEVAWATADHWRS